MMKKIYTNARLEICGLSVEDVIAASNELLQSTDAPAIGEDALSVGFDG